MKLSLKIFLFCISAMMFIGCDRVTKGLAKAHLQNKPTLSYLHDTFYLEYAENTGAALNLGDSLPKAASFWLLSVLPLAFLLILSAYIIREAKQMSFRKIFCFALIIAGGLGNIIDRIIFDRHVTDFMIIRFQNIHTGIFNVADLCVTFGAIGLLIFYRDKKVNAPSV